MGNRPKAVAPASSEWRPRSTPAAIAEIKGWAWNKPSPYPGSPNNDLIYERRRLLIDIDVWGKPKDIAATDAEKLAAVNKGRQVRTWLRKQGGPTVVQSNSP